MFLYVSSIIVSSIISIVSGLTGSSGSTLLRRGGGGTGGGDFVRACLNKTKTRTTPLKETFGGVP